MAGIGTIVAMIKALGTKTDQEIAQIEGDVSEVKNAIQGKYTKPSGGIPASDIADGVIPVVDSALSDSSENTVQNKVVKGAIDMKAPVIINIATGNPAVFNDGGGMPIKYLLIPFMPKQSGTGDPSPENIRPILPWDGLTVWNGGKNLFDISTIVKGTLDGTGALVANDNRRTSAFITLTAGKYTFSRNALVDWWKAWAYKLDGTPIRKLFDGNEHNATITVTETCKIRISLDYVVTAENDVQLEAGNIATAYEPYKPITETGIVFPSPVYGGTLDVVSGVLTVDKAYALLNDADKWTQLTAGQTVDFSYEQDFERKLYDGSLTGLICSAFLAVANQNVAYCRWRGATSLKFGIKNGNSMATPLTLEDVKQMATAGQIAICYDIEPQTVTLTPAQITALVGDNTIWSDADGQMTVAYPADTKTYISNLIATAIASL